MNFKERMIRMMQGRYGMDALGKFLMGASMVLIILNLFVQHNALYMLGIFLIIIEYIRMFSRNIQARYRENQKYLQITAGLRKCFTQPSLRNPFRILAERKASPYRIFTCPQCHQKIRIPKGHGRVAVRCPKCNTEFMRNT
ncbi:MAG: zinc-ribbon domain-containing protein [Lachnospiraceae bacterium]|nr:zinc-ribbon domain-containing protein [Lachnospiraceae bacterium]